MVDPAVIERPAIAWPTAGAGCAARSESDEEEFVVLTDELEARLDEASLRDDFFDLPIETLIREIKADMGRPDELRPTACQAPPASSRPPPGGDLTFDSAQSDTG